MQSIIADKRRSSTRPPVPALGQPPSAIDNLSHGRFLRLLQTAVLTLMILGTFVISGITAPHIPGVATAVRSAGVTVAAPAMSAPAIPRPGNCPGSSSPCP